MSRRDNAKQGGGQKSRPTPEERLAENVRRVQEDGYAVVPRRTLETNKAIALLTKNDFLAHKIRNGMVVDERIDAARAVELLRRNHELRNELNQLNAEMAVLLRMEYEPPKGYDNPLKKQKDGD